APGLGPARGRPGTLGAARHERACRSARALLRIRGRGHGRERDRTGTGASLTSRSVAAGARRARRGSRMLGARDRAHPTEVDMYETLRVEREAHLTWLTLDRPDALNAMSRTLIRELHDFFWTFHDDPETGVLVMRGAGRAFCAGLDLKEQGQGGDDAMGSVQGGLRA